MPPVSTALPYVRALMRGRGSPSGTAVGMRGEFLVQLFRVAAVERFGTEPRHEVIRFVSGMRATSPRPDHFDSDIAVSLVDAAVDREPLPRGLDWVATAPVLMLLLAEMLTDLHLDDDALDDMLILAEQRSGSPAMVIR